KIVVFQQQALHALPRQRLIIHQQNTIGHTLPLTVVTPSAAACGKRRRAIYSPPRSSTSSRACSSSAASRARILFCARRLPASPLPSGLLLRMVSHQAPLSSAWPSCASST